MRQPCSQAGLGLLELVLALALTSIAAALLSQTLGQLGRYEGALSSATAELANVGLLRKQTRMVVANAAALSEPGGGLQGSATKVSFHYFSRFPSHLAQPLPKANIALRNNNGWQLLVDLVAAPGQRIYRGSGTARFRYLDHAGQWHDQWPPPQAEQETDDLLGKQYRLPRAVQLQSSGQGALETFLTLPIRGSLLAPFSSGDF